ncbi:hypothetical protein HanRHA438_Chr16g0759801 [Helianthus annuus]|nr:hypothetical protein HanRHA438_Chr16g0759801 [Helianthus annuus]
MQIKYPTPNPPPPTLPLPPPPSVLIFNKGHSCENSPTSNNAVKITKDSNLSFIQDLVVPDWISDY